MGMVSYQLIDLNLSQRGGQDWFCNVTIRRVFGVDRLAVYPVPFSWRSNVLLVPLIMEVAFLIVLYILIFGPCWAWCIFYVCIKCGKLCKRKDQSDDSNTQSSSGSQTRSSEPYCELWFGKLNWKHFAMPSSRYRWPLYREENLPSVVVGALGKFYQLRFRDWKVLAESLSIF